MIPLLVSSLCTFSAHALDANVSVHQGDESDTKGASFTFSDRVSKSSNFYWNVGYSYLDDVKVEWNNRELFFKVDTVDLIVSYRHRPKTNSPTMRKFSFEYQVGASMALTENKFIWPELDEEKYFSEKNDIKPMMGFNVHYSTSKNTAFNVGFKYQPSFSEFDDITSVYLGFTYKFGHRSGY